MAVMFLVHVTKVLHTHASSSSLCKAHHEQVYAKASIVHAACSICDFQLAKDASFTGEVLVQIAPVFLSPTYSRLLTSINVHPLLTLDSRGPPSIQG
jgi:hypothetical protein